MWERKRAPDLTRILTGQFEAREIFVSPSSGQTPFQSCKWANDDVPSSVG